MGFDLHTIDIKSGSTQPVQQDRLVVGMYTTVANLAGGGAGQSVVTAVTFKGPGPAAYNVVVTPNQDAVAFVSGKTSSGFNVTLNPRLAANTLAAGTFDVLVTH